MDNKLYWIQKQLLKRGDIKTKDDFKNEEMYLMYLATDPKMGQRTRKIAAKRLRNEYPDGLFSLCETQNRRKYTIKYRYRDMKELPPMAEEYNNYIQQFRAIVSYRVYDSEGNKVLSDNKCRVTCGFDNRATKAGEINLFKGLTYSDLSQEVLEQILLDKLKEIILIGLKLNDRKWSDFNEAVIDVEED